MKLFPSVKALEFSEIPVSTAIEKLSPDGEAALSASQTNVQLPAATGSQINLSSAEKSPDMVPSEIVRLARVKGLSGFRNQQNELISFKEASSLAQFHHFTLSYALFKKRFSNSLIAIHKIH